MVKRETMSVGSFSLSPYGKIQASRTWYDGYSESGGATALTYGEQPLTQPFSQQVLMLII